MIVEALSKSLIIKLTNSAFFSIKLKIQDQSLTGSILSKHFMVLFCFIYLQNLNLKLVFDFSYLLTTPRLFLINFVNCPFCCNYLHLINQDTHHFIISFLSMVSHYLTIGS
jgi:hypothetical protein